ncbi:hypothetical protein F4009_00010 [Candidatus Poribacteria bacterium]|nr:hypothetical protein [Candidatus Poribacteria bacterium]MYH82154.1 hypothetical protein [Candidatus Poribacteria bacterium]MYK92384.1 hypothetical protein [Candidatus Poribacteria bacterium]
MLKDLFSNRLFIGALAFFVLCVGGSLLYDQHVKGQTAKALAESEDFLQWWQERNTAEKAVAAEVAESDDAVTASHPEAVGDTAVVAAPTDEIETDNTPDFASLSPEEQQQIFDQFYLQRGLKPPPRGYKYRWKDIGVPLLDEDGNPVLQEEGEPWVEVKYGIGFAPTLEEYEKYEQLQEDQGWAESRGDVAEVARLTAEIEALEASVQRMRPLGALADAVGAEASSKMDAAMDAKFNAALREYDLEHLISPY